MTLFAKAVGLSRHTIMQICNGRLTNPNERTRSAIFAATGLVEFSPNPATGTKKAGKSRANPTVNSPARNLDHLKSAVQDLIKIVAEIQSGGGLELGLMTKSTGSVSPEQHVERIRQVLSALDQELAFFKELDRERDRELLRTRIDPKDVGYIIALLRAMYSKEAFDNWVLASGYSVK
ncbi:MAG: hypothetical protein ACREBZ_02805 [Thermoplasmata archaeon]